MLKLRLILWGLWRLGGNEALDLYLSSWEDRCRPEVDNQLSGQRKREILRICKAIRRKFGLERRDCDEPDSQKGNPDQIM